MSDRTFGLSRFEKIRIEALRAAQKMMALPTVYTRSAEKWPEVQQAAEDIEAWLLSADDAHASAAAAETAVEVVTDEDIAPVWLRCRPGGAVEVVDGVPFSEPSPAQPPSISDIDREVQQFAWLRREVDAVHALPSTATREQVIRRWYETQAVEMDCYELVPIAEIEGPKEDDLGLSADGVVMRWTPVGTEGNGLWITVTQFPGVRVEDKHMKWSPGIWPPMQGGAGGVSEVML